MGPSWSRDPLGFQHGRDGVPSLHSSGEIDVRAVLVTVIEANVIIALAAESTAGAEVEALPFNFWTSHRTCICSVRLTASSWEYPLNLITSGILAQSPGWIGVSLACHEQLGSLL